MLAGPRSDLFWGARYDRVFLASAQVEVHKVNLLYASETQKRKFSRAMKYLL